MAKTSFIWYGLILTQNTIIFLSSVTITLWICKHEAGVHLHQVRLDKKPRLAAAGPADDQHVFVAGILRLTAEGLHGQPLGSGEDDVLLRVGVYKGRYVLCGAPAGGTVLHALAQLLPVQVVQVLEGCKQQRSHYPGEEVNGPEAGQRIDKGVTEPFQRRRRFPERCLALLMPIQPKHFVGQIAHKQVWEKENQNLLFIKRDGFEFHPSE